MAKILKYPKVVQYNMMYYFVLEIGVEVNFRFQEGSTCSS